MSDAERVSYLVYNSAIMQAINYANMNNLTQKHVRRGDSEKMSNDHFR